MVHTTAKSRSDIYFCVILIFKCQCVMIIPSTATKSNLIKYSTTSYIQQNGEMSSDNRRLILQKSQFSIKQQGNRNLLEGNKIFG